MPKRIPSKPLLADEDVARWYASLSRGSKARANEYLRSLARFADWAGLTSHGLLCLGEKARADKLEDFVNARLAKDMAPWGVWVAVIASLVKEDPGPPGGRHK